MSGKRSYTQYAGRPSANYKAARMIGGKVLKYNVRDPVAGSYRARTAIQPSRVYGRSNIPAGLKGVDDVLTQASLLGTTGTNGGIQTLNLIAPGMGSFNRVGRKVLLKSLRLKGYVLLQQAPSTALQEGCMVRMAVVWDHQPTGTVPTFETIFGFTKQDGTESSTVCAPPRYDNMARFKIIKDVTMRCSPQTAGTLAGVAQEEVFPFDEYINLNLTTTYGGQSATCTIADIATGALYIVWRQQELGGAGAVATVPASSVYRLRYID